MTENHTTHIFSGVGVVDAAASPSISILGKFGQNYGQFGQIWTKFW